MIEFFSFVWTIVTGLVTMLGLLVTSIGALGAFVVGFGALGVFLVVLLGVRLVKWVMNR